MCTRLGGVNFKAYSRPYSDPSLFGFKCFNYREAIRAFPNHTDDFHTRFMVL